jgi:hypothetical protein
MDSIWPARAAILGWTAEDLFDSDPEKPIDTVTRLDARGITLVGFRAGLQVTHLNHDFIAAEAGTLYVSTLTIGTALPVLRTVLNPVICNAIFTEAMGHAWLKHNVEEVGLLEHIIPEIYPGGGNRAAERPIAVTSPAVLPPR